LLGRDLQYRLRDGRRIVDAPANIVARSASSANKKAQQETCRPPHRRNEGTKMEEKENFRVQFLHTMSDNYLILFICLPHLWAQRRSNC
jgi:hypothetical protein